ncbi:MAG: hypothetical protein QHH13_00460 [Melioribacter sp.]|uniref:thiol reductase thioredoxin n=1 Tax=Rosettibacter primus TaxID=3111523 RepID=UPI00247B79CB|nr:hypothetical protein [Melioribacter sp.]
MFANSIINSYFRLVIMILLFSLEIIYAQEKCNLLIDEKTGNPMLIGLVDKKIFTDTIEYKPFSKWFNNEYDDYKIDSIIVDSLRNISVQDITIDVIMGTWCSDSRREIPRLMKILDLLKFTEKNLRLICVDRNKSAGEIDIANYNIKLIPTIIIKKKGKEIGRIVETPVVSLEKDLLNILTQN